MHLPHLMVTERTTKATRSSSALHPSILTFYLLKGRREEDAATYIRLATLIFLPLSWIEARMSYSYGLMSLPRSRVEEAAVGWMLRRFGWMSGCLASVNG